MAATSRSPAARLTVLALAVLFLLGAYLRVVRIDQQVVAGDEIHAARAATQQTFAQTFTRLKKADNCMPITAWSRALLVTVGLNEWGFRFLSYSTGILLLLALIRASRGWLPAPERVLLAFLIATSPVLVFWSRMARPYAATTLLGTTALLALHAWCEQGRRISFVIVASSLAPAAVFSPTILPFLGALGLAAAAHGYARHGGEPVAVRLRASLRAASPVAAGFALALVLLLPALGSLLDILGAKKWHDESAGLDTVLAALQKAFGLVQAPRSLLIVGPLVLVLLGLAGVARRARHLLVPLSIVLLLPGLIYCVARLRLIDRPLVFLRYQAPLVPLLLALAAYGLAVLRHTLAARGSWMGHAVLLVAGAAALLNAIRGPLPGALPPANAYGLLTSSLHLPELWNQGFDGGRVSAFYRARAQEERGVVIEWPANATERQLLEVLHSVHGKQLVRCDGFGKPEPGLCFRSLVFRFGAIDSARWGGAWVVLHRDPAAELVYLRTGRRKPAPRGPSSLYRGASRACSVRFGKPVYEDEWLRVYRVPGGGDPPSVAAE